MTLRDHPDMRYHGGQIWPPTWTRSRSNTVKTVRGDVGVLTFVFSRPKLSGKCYLVMDYEGETYVGCLIFESHVFCEQVGDLLRRHLKRSIKDIGDLDLSYTL